MTPFASWMFRLPFIVFIGVLIVLLVGKIFKWESGLPVTEHPKPSKVNKVKKSGTNGLNLNFRNLPALVVGFAREHTWTLVLFCILASLVVLLLIIAPPRLTGEIPSLPGQPGRPFYSLRWLRASLSGYYTYFWVGFSLLCSAASLAILIWAVVKKSPFKAQAALLCISLTLAGLGQWMIPPGFLLQAKIAYAVSIAGFILWAILSRKRIREDLAPQKPLPRWQEIIFIILLLILTAYARLYAFPALPYGIEGDEAKWTSESMNVMLDGRPDNSGEYHRDALPVSYYMEAVFFHLFGSGIFTARLEVIVTSIIATLIFYWLLRQISPPFVAVMGSFLLGSCVFDISASRLANVESHVKLWPILTLALLAYASRTRRWQIYALSGIALALGLLTYDTVWPLALVVVILATVEIVRQADPIKKKVAQFTALIFPSVASTPVLVPYLLSRISYYNLGSKGWNSEAGSTLLANVGGLVASWFVQARTDFLYNRQGPLLNSMLLPWLVLGLVVICLSLRSQSSRWAFVWFFLFILPVPIITNSQMGRVVYPALPAAYIAIAMAILLFWREISRLLGVYKPIAAAIFLGLFLWLPFFNLYIYFNEVTEGPDRLMRREISDIAAEVGGPGHLLLLPVVPGADEPLTNEYQVIEMSLHGKIPVDQIPFAHQTVPYNQFLPELSSTYAQVPYLDILLDKTSPREREQRNNVYAVMMQCYPKGILTTGVYFDTFSLDSAARESPACIPVDLILSAEKVGPGISLNWNLSVGEATQIHLNCHRRIDSLIWMEAEQFTQASGWKAENTFVTEWLGNGFLMDNPGSKEVIYTALLPGSDQAYAWIRYFKRAADNSPAMLSHGGQSIPFAGPSTFLNTWIWERLGPFSQTGSNQWTLTRPYSEDPTKFMALFVDSLVFTLDAQYDPQTSPSYVPLAEEIYPGYDQSQGTIPLALIPGHYMCQALAESDQPLVDSHGNSPVSSTEIEFDIP